MQLYSPIKISHCLKTVFVHSHAGRTEGHLELYFTMQTYILFENYIFYCYL